MVSREPCVGSREPCVCMEMKSTSSESLFPPTHDYTPSHALLPQQTTIIAWGMLMHPFSSYNHADSSHAIQLLYTPIIIIYAT